MFVDADKVTEFIERAVPGLLKTGFGAPDSVYVDEHGNEYDLASSSASRPDYAVFTRPIGKSELHTMLELTQAAGLQMAVVYPKGDVSYERSEQVRLLCTDMVSYTAIRDSQVAFFTVLCAEQGRSLDSVDSLLPAARSNPFAEAMGDIPVLDLVLAEMKLVENPQTHSPEVPIFRITLERPIEAFLADIESDNKGAIQGVECTTHSILSQQGKVAKSYDVEIQFDLSEDQLMDATMAETAEAKLYKALVEAEKRPN